MTLNSQYLQPSASGTSTMQLSNQTAFAKLCTDRAAASQSNGGNTRHVVVADASLPELHILLARLPPDTQVCFIHKDLEALEQIAQAVSHCHNLQGLHILGHGQPGRMLLGEQWVDAQTIACACEHMATLGAALADDAHIWLYGCHSAAGTMGEQWLDAWTLATGVAVYGTGDVWHTNGAGLGLPHQHPVDNPLHTLLQSSGWPHALAANSAPTFFAGSGKVEVSVGTGYDEGRSVIQQADSKLVVAGFGSNGTNQAFSLVRLKADGSLDTSFSTDGKLLVSVGGYDDRGYSVIQQADDKLVVAGYSSNGTTEDFSLVRLNTDGTLDNSFSADGKMAVSVLIGGAKGYSLIQQNDGKLVVAGTSWNSFGLSDFSVVRLNANGTLDTTFGGNRSGKLAWLSGGMGEARSIIQQADGKLVVAGSTENSGNRDFSLVRLNANGTLDTSFDGDGMLRLALGTSSDFGQSVIQQSDGKLVVAGTSWVGSQGYVLSLARLNANGTLDTSFDGDGKLLLPLGVNSSDFCSAIQQADGKLVVLGAGNHLVRLNADGTLDTSFDGDGKLLLPVGTGQTFYSLTQQADGKLVVAGQSSNGNTTDLILVRLSAEGTLDSSFSTLSTNTLGGTVSHAEHGAATVLDADVAVFDQDVAHLNSGFGSYFGASVKLARNGGANPQDLFVPKASGTLADIVQGGSLMVSGTTIGTVTTNSGGTLVLTFDANATQSLVDSALQQIAYKNVSLWQNTILQFNWTFSDGNIGAQGTGGALSATGNVTVNVTATNDLLVLDPSASPAFPAITENTTNPAGISVAGLVVDGSIFDDDKPNPVEAIVIEAVDTRVGTWQFSLNDGATWLNIQADLLNSTANTIGLALGPTALVRLLPFGNLSQTSTSSITFRAWDQSDGKASGSYFEFNTVAVGGFLPTVRSVSLASDVATANVLAVNEGFNSVLPNGTGKVILATAIADSARSVVVQPDGKIVMAGLAYTGSNWDFAVTRLNANGSLDSSFGSGGKTTFGVGTGDDYGQTILARSDGKFVVAGYAINGVTDYFAVAQLNADGSLDTSFGIGGKAVVALGKADRTLHQYLYSGQIAALQPDGKIVLGGSYNLNGAEYGYDFAIARLNTDGSLDNSFGQNGKSFVPGLNGNDLGQAVLVMPNGDIMVAGSSGTGTDFNFATVRVNSSGNINPVQPWGEPRLGTWRSITGLGTGNDYGTSFAAQADGKIVMAGRVLAGSGEELAFSGIDDDYGIVRFLANGQLDTGFGTGGKVVVQMGLFNGGAFGVVLQPDSKILVAGNALNGSDDDFGILRLNSNGTLDTTFGNGGKVIVQVGVNTGDLAHSVTVQPDGKIVVAGTSYDSISPNFSVIRLNANGSLDTALGSTVSTSTGNSTNNILKGTPAKDTFVGGTGFDTADYSAASSGVAAYLTWVAGNSGDAAGDTYTSIEGLTGSAYADVLSGNTGDNTIRAGQGNDWLFGQDGSDFLDGGAGSDVLSGGMGSDLMAGGDGVDVAYYRDAAATAYSVAQHGSKLGMVEGRSYGISIDVANLLNSFGEATSDQLLDIENIWGSRFDDVIRADDAIGGQVFGFEGNDILDGRGGNDVFYGGTGADTLTGGAGVDDFFYLSYNDHYNQYGTLEAYEGGDYITDFKTGVDHITVSRYWFGFGNIQGMAQSLTGEYANFVTNGAVPADNKPSFMWNPASGVLQYDADGAGGTVAIILVTLSPGTNLSLGDIWSA